MMTFTLLFFAVLIIVGVSAVVGFSFFLKRRTKKLRAENQKRFVGEPPPYHSLFEADETDSNRNGAAREKSNF